MTNNSIEATGGGEQEHSLEKSMQNIKFMLAVYSGKKTFIECGPDDKGAFPYRDMWLQEFDVKPGSDWQIRRFKFAIQDMILTLHINKETIKSFLEWLWAYKHRTNE